MFWNLFANENEKNMKRRMLWVELGLLVLLVILIHSVLFAIVQWNLGGEGNTPEARQEMQQSLTWPQGIISSLQLAGGNVIGGLLLIVLVGTVTAQEYNWRTMHLWLSRGVQRPALMAAKFAGLIVAAGLFVLAALASGTALTGLFSLLLDSRLPFEQVSFVQLFLSLLRTTYTLLPYAALTFLLAVASRSTVVAVGGGLAYSLLLEGILMQVLMLVGGPLAKLTAVLPSGLGSSLIQLNGAIANGWMSPDARGPLALLPPAGAALGIFVWTAMLAGLALWIFQKQDLAE